MEEKIKSFVHNNEIIKKFFEYPKEELETIRMLINLGLVDIYNAGDNIGNVRIIDICSNQSYNCLDFIVSFRCNVDKMAVSINDNSIKVKKLKVCQYCNAKNCIRKSLILLLDEIAQYNSMHSDKINYLEIIDYILDRKTPEFKSVPDNSFFKDVDIIDLLYVQAILEADLIYLTKYDEKSIEANYLDLSNKNINDYYINVLLNYYKNKKNVKHIKINLKDTERIFKEEDRFLRVYMIATYYKYIIEYEKVDIILKMRDYLNIENYIQGMKIRPRYFIFKYFQRVEKLPYSKKTKDKIYNLLNYILNYRFKNNITPYIPINILIYSNDKEGIENITRIIGEFMWFFGYLSENMKYYNEYMNNIILDKFTIKKLYYENNKDVTEKNGILLLHNFENLLYTESIQQNLTLNILTDEMEKNNGKVCTIIYGDRTRLKHLLGNYHKLSQMLINLELEIDDLNVDKVYQLIIEKLEKSLAVSDIVKDEIYNYIKATYVQSDIQNMDYVNKLYNKIILNMNNDFSIYGRTEINTKDIPSAYNTRDLPTIMKDLNSLVGLTEIKEQINDLVALLKFNKKANIEISNFNLHMVFLGNPGTGKTTVARLVKDIFFNLGYINQNKLTEVTAKDLIANYLGQTSGKTYNVIKSALGGVLFIDEAYSIIASNGHSAEYGTECVATLLKAMEDYKDKLIIIFAGYEDEMKKFLDSNPGLISRIGYKINFPDYTVEELTQMYLNLLEKNKLKITPKALSKLQEIIKVSSGYDDFGNGRYINNLFQKVLIEHSKNIENKNKKTNLYQIIEEDINHEKLIADNKNKKIGFG